MIVGINELGIVVVVVMENLIKHQVVKKILKVKEVFTTIFTRI